MIETPAHINNEKGIHVRPSGLIFKAIVGYKGKITVNKEGKDVEIRDIISILTLGLHKNSEIKISVDGPEEETMLETLKELFERTYEFEER